MDLTLMRTLGADLSSTTPFFWLVRETLSIPHWAHILAGNTVNWRGNHLKLEAGGTLAEERAS